MADDCRIAIASEQAALATLVEAMLRELYPLHSDIPPTPAGVIWLLTQSTIQAVTGESGIDGFSLATVRTLPFGAPVGSFLATYVRPDCRHGGVAANLRRFTIQAMRALGAERICGTVHTNHPSSHRALERLGFAPVYTTYELQNR